MSRNIAVMSNPDNSHSSPWLLPTSTCNANPSQLPASATWWLVGLHTRKTSSIWTFYTIVDWFEIAGGIRGVLQIGWPNLCCTFVVSLSQKILEEVGRPNNSDCWDVEPLKISTPINRHLLLMERHFIVIALLLSVVFVYLYLYVYKYVPHHLYGLQPSQSQAVSW